MKTISFLLLGLTVSIAFSCATPRPKGSANIVAKARYSNENGFGDITGRVIDPKWRAPLPGANVIILDTKLGADTDRAGTYKISDVPPGTYVIKVAFIGYVSIEHQVQVEENRTIIIDFNLGPEYLNPHIHDLNVSKH